jgi:A/G-specific adenine glycosylase
VWTRGLARWYATNGRHELPWRATAEPWAILVSEVMLQQTQVARVAGRWESFLDRWPTPAACAAASLPEVLREWQGLGYPRRARALHDTARMVAAGGWPDTEAGLRALPGVGQYTARALRVLAFGDGAVPPQDVNIARVTARAALGLEPGQVRQAAIEEHLTQGRPRSLTPRAFTYALFDAGALHCNAVPRCHGCPLATSCASRSRLATAKPQPLRQQPRFRGSTRELRGAVLREMLSAQPPTTIDELQARAGRAALGREPSEVRAALDALVLERLAIPMATASEGNSV